MLSRRSPTRYWSSNSLALTFVVAMPLALAIGEPGASRADDTPITGRQLEFFEKHVRPVLAEHCFECHAIDEPKGQLRVDSRLSLITGGETGPALIPGRPDESELIRAVRYEPDGYQMPPDGKLPDEQIERLAEWVAMGAPWPETSADGATPHVAQTAAFDFEARATHWAFQPLVRPAVPYVMDPALCRTPIDAFLLADLEAGDVAPAPAADRATWLRRVSFDVTGLPPSPAEIHEFLEDPSPDAHERVIDRMLASPRFGERWGRHWLDLVRYAESRGHEFDYDIANPWHYRDYVIRTINDDLPFDQFVVEHVAGDLLQTNAPTEPGTEPPASHRGPDFELRLNPQTGGNESIVATGFWFLGEWIHSPVDIRQEEADRFENMIDVFSKAFLGLTVACARCHDHKFDPITQKDYYALQGYLQSSIYRQVRFETMEHNRIIAEEIEKLRQQAQSELQSLATRRSGRTDDAVDDQLIASSDVAGFQFTSQRTSPPPGTIESVFSTRELSVEPEAYWTHHDVSIPSPDETEMFPVAWWEFNQAAPEPVTSPGSHAEAGATSSFMPGVRLRTPTVDIESGKFHCLVRGGVRVFCCVDSHVMVKGPLHGSVVQDYPVPQDDGWRWITFEVSRYSGHRAHLEFGVRSGEPFSIAAVVQSAETPSDLTVQHDEKDSGRPVVIDQGGHIAATEFTGPREEILHRLETEIDRTLANLRAESAVAPAILDGAGEDEYVFIRGNWKKRGDVVPRRFLEVFGGERMPRPQKGSGRLELARWMVDPEKTPILPRVIVNRIWLHYFGRGIVPTPDDFGHMGQPPSNPELLDWLACELVDNGWSLKHIHRLILNSAAYQMASNVDTQEFPGGNTDTSRQGPVYAQFQARRLEGEIIRDAMFVISGRMDDSMYGRSVPVHLTPFMEGRGKPGGSGPVDGAGRRSIYIAVRRNFLDPFFQAFDMPTPHTTAGQRTVSNVPAQALALMNNPMVREQAGLWAAKLLNDQPDAAITTRIRAAYLAAFAREPTEEELTTVTSFLSAQADELGVTTDDVRVWADLCHVLFNAKEFAFVR